MRNNRVVSKPCHWITGRAVVQAFKSAQSRTDWDTRFVWLEQFFRKYIAKREREFGFTFDPCPLGGDLDGRSPLWSNWTGQRVFCNPPYGPEIRKFLERWSEPDLAVFLLPARVDTRWFHEICLPNAHEIRFIKGRLKFGDAASCAPFPSMVVVFKNGAEQFDP